GPGPSPGPGHSFPVGLRVGAVGVLGSGVDGGGACAAGGALPVCPAASAALSPCPPRAVPAFGPAVAESLATFAATTAAAAGPAAAAPPAPAPAPAPPLAPAPAPLRAAELPPPAAAEPPPSPPALLSPAPSRTFFGSAPPCGLVGVGTGRLRALLASCSEPIAWYMSKPTKLRNL